MPVPPFVARLRALVGNELLWLPGVTAVVINAAGHLLLVRRSERDQWALVRGVLGPGEQPADGILREIREETGVIAKVEAISSIRSDEPMQYPNGDRAQYLEITFLCSVVKMRTDEVRREPFKTAWFAPESLPTGMLPDSRTRVDRTLEFLADPGNGPWFASS